MADVLAWMSTHPFERDELNVMFWISVVGLILVLSVLRFGRL